MELGILKRVHPGACGWGRGNRLPPTARAYFAHPCTQTSPRALKTGPFTLTPFIKGNATSWDTHRIRGLPPAQSFCPEIGQSDIFVKNSTLPLAAFSPMLSSSISSLPSELIPHTCPCKSFYSHYLEVTCAQADFPKRLRSLLPRNPSSSQLLMRFLQMIFLSFF